MSDSPTSNPSDQVLSRFRGDSGRSRLIDAICQQALVLGDRELAAQFATTAIVRELAAGETLIHQDAGDNDLYLVLSGQLEILVNSRLTGHRSFGMHVGEMAAIDPTARRSSTVKAVERTLVAQVTLESFEQIAESKPEIWRRLAIELCRRLRERNRFHPPPRSQPVIFIGSSTEGLRVANEVSENFSHDPFVTKVWSHGVFSPGATTIEALERVSSESDFGILVVTPDDHLTLRGSDHLAPRDNVVFELGLLIGSIGRKRTFMLLPRAIDIRIPTDLLGVTPVTLDTAKSDWMSGEVAAACNKIRKTILSLGPI